MRHPCSANRAAQFMFASPRSAKHVVTSSCVKAVARMSYTRSLMSFFIVGCLGMQSVGLLEALAKILAPALGKRGQFARPAQQVLIRCVCRVKPDDIGHGNAVFVLGDEFERVAGPYVSLSKDSEIEACAAAAKEPLHDIGPIEANTELEARHPGLRHDELRRPGAKSVANVNAVLEHAFGGDVLAESSPRKVDTGELVAPERIVLRRVSVDGLVGPTVDGEIGLLVTRNVQSRNPDPTRHGRLEYGRDNEFTSPLDFARKTGVDREQLHPRGA